jgi:hypothetical protein
MEFEFHCIIRLIKTEKCVKPNKERELYTYNQKLRAEVKKRVLKIKSDLQLQVSWVF